VLRSAPIALFDELLQTAVVPDAGRKLSTVDAQQLQALKDRTQAGGSLPLEG
jgi:hypothetical protein